MKAVVGVLRGAPETLNIKADEVKSRYLIIEPSGDPTAPGTLSISIYVSSDFGSGYIALGPDGSVKRINYPYPRPASPVTPPRQFPRSLAADLAANISDRYYCGTC